VPSDDCSADADCAEGFVCEIHERRLCDETDVPCSSETPEDECPKPEPTQCETETITQCTPRWAAECEDASSCGPGFACVEQINRECSGSSPSDPGAGGAGGDEGGGSGFAPPPDAGVETDPLPPDNGCTEEGSGIFVCELQHVSCETNADCQAGLSCQDSPVTSGCTRPAAPPEEGSGSGGADGAGIDAGAADGDQPSDDAAPEPCETPAQERICAPDGYFEYGGGRGDVDYDGVAGSDDEDGEAAPQSPDDGDGDNNSGTGGPTSGMEPTESDDGTAMEESSGCRAAGSAQSSSLALIALALAGLVSRRKKQRA
jgi:hypothetical protein